MAKKHKKRKSRSQGSKAASPVQGGNPVVYRKPVIPAFWVALAIPLVCLVGAWTYPPVATPMELKSYASQIYLSGLLLLWFWLQRKQPVTTLDFSPARISFGLLFIVGTLSLIWAGNPDFWVYKWNKWYAGFVMFLLGLQITQNEKNLDTICNLAILGGLITAIIGIAQYLFRVDVVPQTSFPSSTFGNGNMAGQVMVLTAPLPLYFLFKDKLTSGKTWFYAFSLCILLLYTYYTRTRAVWISVIFEAFLISIFVLFDRTKRKHWLHWSKTKTQASIASLAIFLILINFNSDGFQPFWKIAVYEISSIATSVSLSGEESGGQRYLIWGTALQMVKDHPVIGAGLGNFFDAYNTGGYSNYRIMGVQRVHNDVLELVVELGFVGLALLLGIIVSMCMVLYKLILRSDGISRVFFALLTIAVTASMMNAQLSFPYQLPVPLVIMPFFVALLIGGSEKIEGHMLTISMKSWFPKAAIAVSACLFVLITINDALWFRDIRMMNQIVAGQIKNTAWKPLNPIFNQAYITGARSVNQALARVNSHQLGQDIIEPLLDYWPDVPANTLMAAENYLALKKYDEAEYWARKTIPVQPPGSYIGQYYLMQIYMRNNRMGDLKKLYESMKEEPESLLSKNRNTYNMMHSMSINTKDFDMTEYYFEKFMEYFGEFAPVIANQAVFYINTGRVNEAVPYMKRALELDPNIVLAKQFREYLNQITGQ